VETQPLPGRDRLGFDPCAASPAQAQQTMSQLVVPRPIAMISTRSADGVANVSPFSYFMAVTGRPLTIAVTMGLHEDGQPKDTYRNAMAAGAFVVNVTSEPFRDDIETVARHYPPEVDELATVGWTAVPSVRVAAPSVAEAPASLECEVRRVIDVGEPGVAFSQVWLVVAEVVYVTLRPEILDERGRIDPMRLGAIGRLGLRSYLRTVPEGTYELERIPYRATP
jgi:flavin reductase (DIM6/NTAB) family NADH-FMN oxidoreductase RutF